MRVLILAHLTSYMPLMASRIVHLVAFKSTRNTSVFISSIFFIADSVVTGHLMILNLSILFLFSTDLFGYLGLRFVSWVFGRRKCTLVRTFFTFRDTEALAAFVPFGASAIQPLRARKEQN